MLKHLYARCYWMSTMEETFKKASIGIAASRAWANPQPGEIVLLKPNYKGKGRPESTRLSSRMDGFKTGSKRKRKANSSPPELQNVLRLPAKAKTSGAHTEDDVNSIEEELEEYSSSDDEDSEDIEGSKLHQQEAVECEPEYDSDSDYMVKG